MSVNRLTPLLQALESPAGEASRRTKIAPLVSVVIVNYRRWAETSQLVEQLQGEGGLFRDRTEIVIIDNASPPDACERRLRGLPGVRIFRMPRNCGFSAGVNEGMRRARGRWLLVMNSDLSVAADFLDQVCATALDFESVSLDGVPVGVVGFRLQNADGGRQLSTGRFPTLGSMLAGLLRPRATRKYQLVAEQGRQRVPWVTGSCLLIRKACLKRLGGFDENFFLYYEDVDLCRRAAQAGWSVCYDPSIRAAHLDPLQNRTLSPAMRAITRHAALTYFHKHLPGRPARRLSRIIRVEAWLRQKWAALRGRCAEATLYRKLRGVCRDLDQRMHNQAGKRLQELIQLAGL